MKKWIAYVLTLLMLLSLTGCGGGTAEAEPSPTPTATASPSPSPAAEAEDAEQEDPFAPLLAARDAYSADTVVMKLNGQEVTWDLYYYVLGNYIRNMIYQLGTLPEDFQVDIGGMTMDEYIRQVAEGYLRQCQAATEHSEGLVDKAAVEEQVEEDWTQLCERNGGEEATEELLSQDGLTRRAYDYFTRVLFTYEALEKELYGEGGSALTQEEIEQWTEEQGLVRCKHILLRTDKEDMSEEDKAAAKESMETYLEDLKAVAGDPEELHSLFDTLMEEHSEDTGLAMYPDGYVFGKGEMMEAFETAAFALEPYGLSELVETPYGYHILLRLPMDRDAVADIDQSSYQSVTLAQMVARGLYQQQLEQWRGEIQVELTEEFQDFSVQTLLYGDEES